MMSSGWLNSTDANDNSDSATTKSSHVTAFGAVPVPASSLANGTSTVIFMLGIRSTIPAIVGIESMRLPLYR